MLLSLDTLPHYTTSRDTQLKKKRRVGVGLLPPQRSIQQLPSDSERATARNNSSRASRVATSRQILSESPHLSLRRPRGQLSLGIDLKCLSIKPSFDDGSMISFTRLPEPEILNTENTAKFSTSKENSREPLRISTIRQPASTRGSGFRSRRVANPPQYLLGQSTSRESLSTRQGRVSILKTLNNLLKK